MTQPEIEIRRAWRQIAGHHHDGHIDALLARYREPHRRYHTATHIMWVLRHLHDMSSTLSPSSSAPSAELLAATLYHDAIYDPPAGDNEARSAALAVADLAEVGWPRQRCVPVRALILATAGHLADNEAAPPADSGSAETAMLLDADLAILGAEPGAHQAYVNGVRAEYAHVNDDEWRTGRARVLQHFLDRQRLFVTDVMHTALDHRARANIEAELAALRRSAASD